MTRGEIEICVGDVSDVEARVVARCNFTPAAMPDSQDNEGEIVLTGTARGPYCASARTLPATFEFHAADPAALALRRSGEKNTDQVIAEAVISDPCLWSAELPHMYQVDVEARCGERVIAEYHGQIGLQRTTPRRPYDFSTTQ